MGRPGKPKTSKQEILDVAERLFKIHGYDGTMLQMVADELSVTVPTITYYFKYKYMILATLFGNMFRMKHEYIRKHQTGDFNYYLYYCILTISVFRDILKRESNWKLFYHKDHVKYWLEENIAGIERRYRLITDDFHQGFTNDEVRVAAILDIGSKLHLFEEFKKDDPFVTAEKFGYYEVYTIGIFSRLDEGTIQRNIKRAYDFLESHTLPTIFLME